jgi:hypothetical protein
VGGEHEHGEPGRRTGGDERQGEDGGEQGDDAAAEDAPEPEGAAQRQLGSLAQARPPEGELRGSPTPVDSIAARSSLSG